MEILEADLTSLLDRIEQSPVLREHHVWEAARCLSIDLRDRRSSTRRFAELIAAGAVLDAVMVLIALTEPQRIVSGIRNVEGRWSCTLQAAPVPTQRPVGTSRAEHQDLPAALLMSLLLSFRQGRRGFPRRAAAPATMQQERPAP
jgi:hypothetical protein